MKRNILITGAKGFVGKNIKGGKRFNGNIVDFGSLMEAVDGCEGIVHLAAKSNKRACDLDADACILSNIYGAYNVLEAGLIKNKWVLFISTFQAGDPHLYGISKLFGEELCLRYKRLGLTVKIMRLPVVYGKGDKADKLVNKFINAIKEGKKLVIDTDDKFPFGYVKDVARAIEKEVKIIRLGEDVKHSLRELRDCIMEILSEKKV